MSAAAPPDQGTEFPTSYEQYQEGNWPYEVVPLNPEERDDAMAMVGLHEFAFKAEDGELYAGCYPRAMINNAAYTDQPLVLGASVTGNRMISVDPEERYRHMFGGGRTGEGKTVSATNACQQDGLNGNGFCFMDPGGEDILNIVRMLPDYRLDDIIYMEPGNEYREYSIGLNYLDTLHSPGEPGYAKECESIAANILPMINANDYARMKGVASNMLRYLIKEDYERDYEYTLIDLYFILCSEVGRERYAHLVDQSELEFLKPYAKEIAELAGDDFEPLIRRLQSWVEDDVIRPFIAQRDSDFSIADAINNNRIILVKSDLGKTQRELVSAAITTKLWTAITSRPGEDELKMMEYEGVDIPDLGMNEDGEYDPYFLVADEFHAIASEEDDIGEMLKMARKKGLGIFLLTQQIRDLSKSKQGQILGNSSTILAFNPGRSPAERSALASGFNGVSESDLGIEKYTFWTTMEGSEDRPFLTHSTPPYPPVRTVREANEALNAAQKRYGSKRLTSREIIDQIPAEFTPESMQGSGGLSSAPSTPSEATRAYVCKAAYDAAYLNGYDDGWIPLKEAHDRIRRYLEDTPFNPETPSQTREIIKNISPEDLESADRDDGNGVSIRCTPLGRRKFTGGGNSDKPPAIKELEDGNSVQENEGSWAHLQIIQDCYDDFLDLGLVPEIPSQDGGAMPDALISVEDVDVPEMTSAKRFEVFREELRQFEEDHPAVARLTGGTETYVELEKSTADSDPGQTVLNLAKAVKADKRCLFITRPSTSDNVWRTLMEEPRFCRVDWSVEGQDRLYNQGDLKLETSSGKETMYRPALNGDGADRTAWIREGDRYILMDSDGNEHAIFESAEEIFEKVEKYPHHASDGANSEKWTAVKKPVVPEYVFDGQTPDRSAYDVLVSRSDDTPLQLYEDGMEIALDTIGEGSSPTAQSQSSSQGKASGSGSQSESVLDQL